MGTRWVRASANVQMLPVLRKPEYWENESRNDARGASSLCGRPTIKKSETDWDTSASRQGLVGTHLGAVTCAPDPRFFPSLSLSLAPSLYSPSPFPLSPFLFCSPVITVSHFPRYPTPRLFSLSLSLVVPHDDGWAVRVHRVRLAHCARLRVAAAVERRDPRKERKRRRTRALGRAVQHRLFHAPRSMRAPTADAARASESCGFLSEFRVKAARAGRTVAGRPLSRIARRNSDQRAVMATVRRWQQRVRGHIEE